VSDPSESAEPGPDVDSGEEGWPVELRGVTESLVTTLGPNDLWNVAALGLHPPEAENGGNSPVTARTWGNTRTRRNFHRQGGGYVQFTRDPVDFVDATLSIYELEDPVLDSADAWVEVEVEQVDSGESGETDWEEWELRARESAVERETVPTINRGFGAVVEATVAASRLNVAEYDEAELRNRLDYFESVGRNCGDDRACAALDRLRDHLDE
jgi:hypothetical protein